MIYYCLNFEILKKKKNSHWIVQRFAILLSVPLIYFVCEYNTFDTLIVCFFILSFHFFEGLIVIVEWLLFIAGIFLGFDLFAQFNVLFYRILCLICFSC